MDMDTTLAVLEAAKMLSSVLKELYPCDGISLSQNGGACNELSHFHLHLVPRFVDDGYVWEEPTRSGREALSRFHETRSRIASQVRSLVERS
jgi:histidine triad (HIT) family protein